MKKSNNTSDKLKLIAIKAKNKVFISSNIKNKSYYGGWSIENYLFDGDKPKETYKSDWFEVKQIPQQIQKEVPSKKINIRYELKENFQESELTPKVINEQYIDEDSMYYEVRGLYDKKYDLTEPTYENVEFEINVIEELDSDFEIVRQDYYLQHNLLDEITTHPILLPTKPCSLTREESYRIVRNYIKHHIDRRYAYISSDYDFCLTVKKRIDLYEPYTYQVNVNQGTRRKPRYETKFHKSRDVVVYKTAPKPYQDYTVIEPFTGKNADDLNNNIKLFLEELIAKINEPLVDCPHCKGHGVILKGDDK